MQDCIAEMQDKDSADLWYFRQQTMIHYILYNSIPLWSPHFASLAYITGTTDNRLPYYAMVHYTLQHMKLCMTGVWYWYYRQPTMGHHNIPPPQAKPCLGRAASEQIPWCVLALDMESLHIGDYAVRTLAGSTALALDMGLLNIGDYTHWQCQKPMLWTWGY